MHACFDGLRIENRPFLPELMSVFKTGTSLDCSVAANAPASAGCLPRRVEMALSADQKAA
jgi:hypothetical protein